MTETDTDMPSTMISAELEGGCFLNQMTQLFSAICAKKHVLICVHFSYQFSQGTARAPFFKKKHAAWSKSEFFWFA